MQTINEIRPDADSFDVRNGNIQALDSAALATISGGATTTTCTNFYRLNGNLKKTVCTTTTTD